MSSKKRYMRRAIRIDTRIDVTLSIDRSVSNQIPVQRNNNIQVVPSTGALCR
jgi:hypothetical protein